ncbi:MAG: glycosyltransferase family 2 protein [Elusimicrobia bacterium]|nr:glycosyltransferase family 2 protein [Elusimicrobiota bacterium]
MTADVQRRSLSIVIPVLNEGTAVRTARDAVASAMKETLPDTRYEILFVDDGSTDDTFSHIAELAQRDPSVKALKLMSNCGSHAAIRAGLEHATGDMAVFMACDLQDPPGLIARLVEKLAGPYEVVLAVRSSRSDGWYERLTSRLFFAVMRCFISDQIPRNGASMYLLGPRALAALRHFEEKNMTLESLFVLMGFKQTAIFYHRNARTQGESKWTFQKKIKLFVDFFVAYSFAPIRFVTLLGVSFSVFGAAWTAYIVGRHFLRHDLSPGWPALLSVLLMGFGVTNISLGIIAEYLWRVLDETRKRPRYLIEAKLNLK